MYSKGSGLVFGFHGCDEDVAKKVINGEQSLSESKNEYDWLGNGIYFWENSPSRALEYAYHLKENPKKAKNPIKKPAVIGAIIDLGSCLDLLDYEKLALLKFGYEILEVTLKNTQKPLPKNKIIGNLNELMLRELNCAVIETLHKAREKSKFPQFDSVRGVFWEGKELYPNAGFREKRPYSNLY